MDAGLDTDPVFGTIRRRGWHLPLRTVGRQQQRSPAAGAQSHGDHRGQGAGHREAEQGVERSVARPGQCDDDSTEAEHQDVLVALLEDEEAVGAVGNDPGDHHDPDGRRGGQGRQETRDETGTGEYLDDRAHRRPDHPVP